MPATFALWRDLERQSHTHLMQLTGGLFAGPDGEPFVQGCRQTLDALEFPYLLLDSAALRNRFPHFRIPDGWTALYQEHSGILAATRCVLTMAAQAARHGAEVREQTRVLAVEPAHLDTHGDDSVGIAVRIAGPGGEETIYADQAVITAGPWASRLLAPLMEYPLPLRVTHQQIAYFATPRPDQFSLGRFPIFAITSEPTFYGFPIWERAGAVKIAVEQLHDTVDPDGERAVDPKLLEQLSALVAGYLPGLNPKPIHVELCLYTETPTRDFIVDRHPHYPQILIGAGFSGRGFKHTIAIGRLLADLAHTSPGVYESPFWNEEWRITRFVDKIQSQNVVQHL
jgi:monomeric sarcosine oxidase